MIRKEYHGDGYFRYATIYDPEAPVKKIPRHPIIDESTDETTQYWIKEGRYDSACYFTRMIRQSALTVSDLQRIVSRLNKQDTLTYRFRKYGPDFFYKYQNQEKNLQMSFKTELGIGESYWALKVYTSQDF